jgi:hypothetical protein
LDRKLVGTATTPSVFVSTTLSRIARHRLGGADLDLGHGDRMASWSSSSKAAIKVRVVPAWPVG